MTDIDNAPDSAVAKVHSTQPPVTRSIADHLIAKRPAVRKSLLIWSGIFVATFALFLLIANVPDLRTFDAVFLPTVFLLVIVAVTFGYVAGRARGLRYCLKWAQRQPKAPAPAPEA